MAWHGIIADCLETIMKPFEINAILIVAFSLSALPIWIICVAIQQSLHPLLWQDPFKITFATPSVEVLIVYFSRCFWEGFPLHLINTLTKKSLHVDQ